MKTFVVEDFVADFKDSPLLEGKEVLFLFVSDQGHLCSLYRAGYKKGWRAQIIESVHDLAIGNGMSSGKIGSAMSWDKTLKLVNQVASTEYGIQVFDDIVEFYSEILKHLQQNVAW